MLRRPPHASTLLAPLPAPLPGPAALRVHKTERLPSLLQPMSAYAQTIRLPENERSNPPPNAQRLATLSSQRVLRKTVAELCAAEPLPAVDPAAVASSTGSDPAPGALTRFWNRLPEGADAKATLQQALSVPLLKRVAEDLLWGAISSGHLRTRALLRDEQLPLDGLSFVVSGQLALGLFSEQTLSVEASFLSLCVQKGYEGSELAFQRGLRRGPLARAAIKNLLVLEAGDVIGSSPALQRFRAKLPDSSVPLLYATSPAVICVVDASLIEDWGRLDPSFQTELEATQLRCLQAAHASSLLADLYIREGISVAQTLRVVDADRCVHCRDCERACAERHGHARLSIAGPSIGRLILPDTCRTCSDQRCVSACGFDALTYDTAQGEVIINEDKCVGCSYCQTACPYGAIAMIDLAAAPRFAEKMAERSARGRPNAGASEPHPLVDRRLRVASKCDHCAGYADQACISACQHEALFELRPQPLFFRVTKAEQALGDTGRPASREAAELRSAELSPLPPLASRMPGPASHWPGRTLGRAILLLTAVLLGSALLSGRHLSHSSGYGLAGGVLGLLCLLGAWAFPSAARKPWLMEAATRTTDPSRLARLVSSTKFHASTGIAGLLLVLLHARFLPSARDPLALFAFLFLVLTSVCGLFVSALPRWITAAIASAQIESERLHARLFEDSLLGSEARRAALAAVYKDNARLRRATAPAPADRGPLHDLRNFFSWVASLRLFIRAPRPLVDLPVHESMAPELLRTVRELILAQRQQLLLPSILGIVKPARYGHLASAVLLLVLSLSHVISVIARW